VLDIADSHDALPGLIRVTLLPLVVLLDLASGEVVTTGARTHQHVVYRAILVATDKSVLIGMRASQDAERVGLVPELVPLLRLAPVHSSLAEDSRAIIHIEHD